MSWVSVFRFVFILKNIYVVMIFHLKYNKWNIFTQRRKNLAKGLIYVLPTFISRIIIIPTFSVIYSENVVSNSL